MKIIRNFLFARHFVRIGYVNFLCLSKKLTGWLKWNQEARVCYWFFQQKSPNVALE